MARYRSSSKIGCLVGIFWLGIIGLVVSTWLTHIVHCFTHGEVGFLIAGAIFVPVANIHGFGLWFGWW